MSIQSWSCFEGNSEGFSFLEPVQLLNSIGADQVEAKAEGDDTAEKVEKDNEMTTLKHLMNLEKDLDFVRFFAVPTWHWNDFAFEGKYEEIRELRFTVTLYMNR